jgi:two-component system chemotaxis family response regulator WspR
MTNASNAPLGAPATLLPSRTGILVLLVDDQLVVGEAVRRALLDQPDIELHFCSDCHQAAEIARTVKPTVILQDLVMPGISGLDLVKQYRADSQTSHIPIIVLSTKEEAVVKRDAFLLGANDYLVKLPDPIELVARIRYHSNAYLTHLQRDEAYRALRHSQQELMETNSELKRLTQVDGLTGLSNRRYLNDSLDAEWKHLARLRAQFSLLMIDVDHFKLYNDTYGHLAGDEVLQKVAGVLKGVCRRSTDIAARYGGEEFAVVLPSTPGPDAQALGQAAAAAVEALHLPHARSATSEWVTISVGVATRIPTRGEPPSTLVKIADEALYEAKRSGRNRAVFHG